MSAIPTVINDLTDPQKLEAVDVLCPPMRLTGTKLQIGVSPTNTFTPTNPLHGADDVFLTLTWTVQPLTAAL